jgi:hypothetical protein
MWQALLNQLHLYYNSIGRALTPNEINYLSNAFHNIDSLYNANLTSLKPIKYIMLSEAPLWGTQVPHKYVYNLQNLKDSSFFRVKNMRDALNISSLLPITNLSTKQDLVYELNLRGFLILDICPYALNKSVTSINYGWLSRKNNNNYQNLIQPTLSLFFNSKLQQIQNRLINNRIGVKVFYRYPRIEKHLGIQISSILNNYGMGIMPSPLNDIFKQGGGIDINKLSSIL